MKLNIDSSWLIRMAEKEDSRIVSVGGLVTRIDRRIAEGEATMTQIEVQAGQAWKDADPRTPVLERINND